MNNKSHSPVTEMLSGKYKIWLIIGLAIMLAADVSACIVLWIHGVGLGYWVIPFMTALFDLLYLLGVVFSNQRFKYARLLFDVYIIFTVIMCAAWILSATLADGLVFDNATVVVWSILHAVGIAAAIVTYLYASRRIRGGKTFQFVLAIAVSCVVVLGCGIYYAIGLFKDGYFGQGIGNRPLVYEYLDNDECAVTGVVSGNETSVVVPYEFNGKKVTSVSASVLTDGIESVTLKCDAGTSVFTDAAKVRGINSKAVINVEKESLDVFKAALYSRSATRTLGNRLRPAFLAEDEVFITFEYDEQAFELADKTLLPTWYGKKGDVFKLSDIKNIPYAKASDVDSDEDLYYSYNNTDKYIMSAPVSGGTKIDGEKITESCENVPVRFQRVYRVYPGASDDSKYDTKKYFTFSKVDGVELDYKLTVADNADKLLDAFERDGFTRTMYYKTENSGALIMFDTLKSALAEAGDDVTILPRWKLNAPEVTVGPAEGYASDVVYGERFMLNASVAHPILDELDVKYEWYEKGERVNCIGDKLVVDKTDYAGKGQYAVIVTISAPAITSCQASVTTTTDINISRRPLTVAWSELSDYVYNNSNRTVTATLGNTITGDDIALGQSTFTMRDAKTYTFTAELDGDDKDCYYIVDKDTSKSYTIVPRSINVTWGEVRSFEYNGYSHIPNAYAYDLSGAPIVLTKSGEKIDVGEDYIAKAVVRSDTNYVVADIPENAVKFSIYPKTVEALWGDTEFIYNAATQVPEAKMYDVEEKKVALTVTGGKINANIIDGKKTIRYIATATSPDKNYTVSAETAEKEFSIDQREARINWDATEFTYNGQQQAPTGIGVGLTGANLALIVGGGQTDAITEDGQKYTATARLVDSNYKIESGYESREFVILPYVVNVVWTNTSLTYNGESQAPTATAKGVNGVDIPLDITGAQTDAGKAYTAYAEFVTADSNYRLQNTEVLYDINKKSITVSWTNLQFEYDGDEHIPMHTVSGAIGNIACEVWGSQTDAGNNYTATFTLNDDNHMIASGATCTFRIIPKSVAVTWTDTSLTYNGNPQAPTASASGIDGYAIPLNITGSATDFGEHTATATTPDKNYTLTNAQGKFEIGYKAISVTVDSITVEYGQTPEYTFTQSGIISGDDVEIVCSVVYTADENGNIPAGTYDITVTLSGNAKGNYSLTVENFGTLTVSEPEPEQSETEE